MMKKTKSTSTITTISSSPDVGREIYVMPTSGGSDTDSNSSERGKNVLPFVNEVIVLVFS